MRRKLDRSLQSPFSVDVLAT
uniref:Uncharacterized protein n=1 Tax=Anguilla anguilla TaxID=7936 RepID=A0A0E9VGS7_ANGAN